jgi:hypothetical protein
MRPGKRHPRAAERKASQGRRVCDAARVKPRAAVVGIPGAHCLLLVARAGSPGQTWRSARTGTRSAAASAQGAWRLLISSTGRCLVNVGILPAQPYTIPTRCRLSLARAVYARHGCYLLDDPIASVDGHVGVWTAHGACNGTPRATPAYILTMYTTACLHPIRRSLAHPARVRAAAPAWGHSRTGVASHRLPAGSWCVLSGRRCRPLPRLARIAVKIPPACPQPMARAHVAAA